MWPMCPCPRQILTATAEPRWQEERTGKPVWFQNQIIGLRFQHQHHEQAEGQKARKPVLQAKALPAILWTAPIMHCWWGHLGTSRTPRLGWHRSSPGDPGFREWCVNTGERTGTWMLMFQPERKCLQTSGYQLIKIFCLKNKKQKTKSMSH